MFKRMEGELDEGRWGREEMNKVVGDVGGGDGGGWEGWGVCGGEVVWRVWG